MYEGLTPEICAAAWEVTLPSVLVAATKRITNKRAGTIIVLSPHSGEIIFTDQIDFRHESAVKYETIALHKARVSYETGLSSRQVQQDAPHLYRSGMTKWGGSVIENKLVVAFSGVEAIFDEAIAGTMLRWIVALCQHEMTRPGGVMEADSSFIGGFEHRESPTGGWPTMDDL